LGNDPANNHCRIAVAKRLKQDDLNLGWLGFRTEERNDSWRWAMLSLGDCRLMVDESINVHPDIPRTSVLYLYPDDVSEFHEQLRRNGVVVPDLEVTFYGMTEFRIDDPDGNRLWIGQRAPTGNSDPGARGDA